MRLRNRLTSDGWQRNRLIAIYEIKGWLQDPFSKLRNRLSEYNSQFQLKALARLASEHPWNSEPTAITNFTNRGASIIRQARNSYRVILSAKRHIQH